MMVDVDAKEKGYRIMSSVGSLVVDHDDSFDPYYCLRFRHAQAGSDAR